MSPLAQLLQRHRDRLRQTPPALWLNPPFDLPHDLLSPDALVCVQDEALRQRLQQRGIEARFGAWPPAHIGPGPVLFTLPREKARLRMMAHALAGVVGDGGTLLAAGEIRAGARSAARHLEAFFEVVQKQDAARHCVLYEARSPRRASAAASGPGENDPAPAHLGHPAFAPGRYVERWSLDAPGGPLTICSLPGVFAHGALDAGTALLLEGLEALFKPAGQRVLDLGCGAGVIGAVLKRFAPSIDLLMADSNALALEATRATLAANELSATVVASNGLDALSTLASRPGGTPFDLVISNPPFHDGHRERDDRGAGVFTGIERVLAPGGRLVIVVNRHLPWPRWLDATFGSHDVLAQNRGFQVLSASARPHRRGKARHDRR